MRKLTMKTGHQQELLSSYEIKSTNTQKTNKTFFLVQKEVVKYKLFLLAYALADNKIKSMTLYM